MRTLWISSQDTSNEWGNEQVKKAINTSWGELLILIFMAASYILRRNIVSNIIFPSNLFQVFYFFYDIFTAHIKHSDFNSESISQLSTRFTVWSFIRIWFCAHRTVVSFCSHVFETIYSAIFCKTQLDVIALIGGKCACNDSLHRITRVN